MVDISYLPILYLCYITHRLYIIQWIITKHTWILKYIYYTINFIVSIDVQYVQKMNVFIQWYNDAMIRTWPKDNCIFNWWEDSSHQVLFKRELLGL